MTAYHESGKLNRLIAIYLAALTVYSVLAFGLTTEFTKSIFDVALFVGVLGWVSGLAYQKRLPVGTRMVSILCLLIVIYGWIAVWNAEYRHSWENGFSPHSENGQLDWLPSTINFEVSKAVMIRISLLASAFVMLIDISQSRTNRRILISGIALAGLTIALVGLFQKASAAETLIFHDLVLTEKRFFASYRYHGNAATVLNFAWPVSFILLLRSKIKGSGPLLVSVWGVSFVFTFVAVFVNTSKIGQVLGFLMIVVILFGYRKQCKSVLKQQFNPWIGVLTAGAVIAALAFFLINLSFSTTVSRWADFETSAAARAGAYRICLEIIPTSGLFGLGPGAFSTIFPYAAKHHGVQLQFFWNNAHQDYLQLLIEWGIMGAVIWLLLFGLVVQCAIKRLRSRDFYSFAIVISLGASLVQAMVDFPFQIASLQWVAHVLVAGLIASPESVRSIKGKSGWAR